MVRVAGRDRLGYRRRGVPADLADQLGRALGVPAFVVRPARRRLTLRHLAALRRRRSR